MQNLLRFPSINITPARSKKLAGWIFILIFIFSLCVMIWKAPYGFASTDECYYLAIPYRMCKGDALISHEWHVTQPFAFLIYPALSLVLKITGSTDGILLIFRYVYVFVQGMVTLFLYLRMRRIHPWMAVFGSLLFFLYTPYNIMALSYNTMGIQLFSLTLFTLASIKNHPKMDGVFAGLCFAGSVLCCPYLVLVYALFTLLVLIGFFQKKLKGMNRFPVLLQPRLWALITLGILILASLFLALIFTRSTLQEFLQSLPHAITNPTHAFTGPWGKITTIFKVVASVHAYSGIILLVWVVVMILILLDRGRQKRCILYSTVVLILTAIYLYPLVNPSKYLNLLMFPLNMSGLGCYLLTTRKQKNLFYTVWIPGILFAFCTGLSSNMGALNIFSVSVIPSIASIGFMLRFAAEKQIVSRVPSIQKIVLFTLIAGIIGTTFAATLQKRIAYTFWDISTKYLSVKINEGPEKGLITNPDFSDTYLKRMDETASLRKLHGGLGCYITNDQYLQLADPNAVGSFTSYSEGDITFIMKELEAYFELYPSRKATYIFVDQSFASAKLFTSPLLKGYTVSTTSQGNTIAIYNDGDGGNP